ncbi:hypothetical protein HDU96_002630 [Phlyctochytrium bullatum]|nr:hypothetical protein HDU96_002630 [Phlyctochytrium bullatum]
MTTTAGLVDDDDEYSRGIARDFRETVKNPDATIERLMSLFSEVAELPVTFVKSEMSDSDLGRGVARLVDHRLKTLEESGFPSLALPQPSESAAPISKTSTPETSLPVSQDTLSSAADTLFRPTEPVSRLLRRHGLTPEAAEYSYHLNRFGPFSVERVLGFIDAMKTVDSVDPDRLTYIAAARVLAVKGQNGDMALAIVKKMEEEGFPLDWEAYHVVMLGWVRQGYAKRAFKQLKIRLKKHKGHERFKQIPPLPISVFNTVLSGLVGTKDVELICQALDLLYSENLIPDAITWNIILNLSGQYLYPNQTNDILTLMQRLHGIPLRIDTCNILLAGFFRRKKLAQALSLFEDMLFPKPNSPLVFPQPNLRTFTTVIGFCSMYSMQAHLRRYVDMLHARMGEGEREGLKPDAALYKVLLKVSVREGDIKSAAECFKDLMLHSNRQRPFEVNQLIELHGAKGSVKEMLGLFYRMLAQGVKPTLRTYRLLRDALLGKSDFQLLVDVLSSLKAEDYDLDELRQFFGETLVVAENIEKDAKKTLRIVQLCLVTCGHLPPDGVLEGFERRLVESNQFEALFALRDLFRSHQLPGLRKATYDEILRLAAKGDPSPRRLECFKVLNNEGRDTVYRLIAAAKEDYGQAFTSSPAAYNARLCVVADMRDIGYHPRFRTVLDKMKKTDIPWTERTFQLVIYHALEQSNFSLAYAVWCRYLKCYDEHVFRHLNKVERKSYQPPLVNIVGKRRGPVFDDDDFNASLGDQARSTLLHIGRTLLRDFTKHADGRNVYQVLQQLKNRGVEVVQASSVKPKGYRRYVAWVGINLGARRSQPRPKYIRKAVNKYWREMLGIKE